ncbi:Storkhead-box protein 1 [Atta colombica]|uniref:Storkhead-box protein 1 n=1 Tax=Atta colombica TaxID=520822 RepID=A0A195B2L4_9HYME|nr:Storkhead-box protein 1 [Atta colombica]
MRPVHSVDDENGPAGCESGDRSAIHKPRVLISAETLFDRSRYTFYENGPREKYFLDTRTLRSGGWSSPSRRFRDVTGLLSISLAWALAMASILGDGTGPGGPGPSRCLLLLQRSLAIQLIRGSPPHIANAGQRESPKEHPADEMWMYDKGYNLFQSFLEANSKCWWNAALVDATRQLRYKGHVSPGVLMVSGPPCALEVLRAAWARNVLRPPADHSITCLGVGYTTAHNARLICACSNADFAPPHNWSVHFADGRAKDRLISDLFTFPHSIFLDKTTSSSGNITAVFA